MKNYLFIICWCLAGTSFLVAQNKQTTKDKNFTTEGKEKFIKNQDYLSATPLNPSDNHYGDSLKGFDAEHVKQVALANNVYGEEYINYMILSKRLYVNAKYKLGESFQQPVKPVPGKKGTGNQVLGAPCSNEDFEATTVGAYTTGNGVTGWSVSTGFNSCNINTSEGMPTSWSSGSPEFWIVQTPILSVPYIGNLPNSPLGGNVVAQLQDQQANGRATRLSQTFPVTQANTAFQFAYAGVYQDGTHDCCNQPFLKIRMFDCNGAPLGCSSLSLNPGGQGCAGVPGYTVTNGVSWTNWQVKFIDLTPYLGSCVTIEVINSDCAPTGHWASTYFDAMCGGQVIGGSIPQNGQVNSVSGPVSFCSGGNQAQIAAPFGYGKYQWFGPGGGPSNPGPMIAAPNGTNQVLVLTPSPQQGAIYTVSMQAQSGCMFVSSNTLVFTQVNIAAISTESSCPMGSSGSATVFGNGSGSGYNYTWTAASNGAVVSTASVASNLAPGIYSITITGAGSVGCGTAQATATIFPGGTVLKYVTKPYCGGQAYLQTQGGSGFQWYSPGGLITGTAGALPHYTVTSPSSGAIYVVTYTTTQGCKDSIRYMLVQTPAGFATVPSNEVKLICPSASNGTAAVHISPAVMAPVGFNSYSVFSTGQTPPYSAGINQTASNDFTVSGLSKGTYSVTAFDGSCWYSTQFTVNDLQWSFTVTPATRSLCPKQFTTATIAATTNFQTGYTYSWSPTTWMNGSLGTFSNALIAPTIAVGTNSSVVYTVVMTPTIAICPQSRTFTITAVSPPVPQIVPIKPQCNTFAPYQVTLTPSGGTVTNAGTASLTAPINQGGILTPSLGLFGNNTFTYAIQVYTCVTTNTFMYEVSKFYPSTLTSTVPNLCETNSPFNLMSIVQNTTNGTWTNNGPGQGVIGGTHFNPSLSGAGNYQLKYTTLSSPNPTVCPVSSVLSVSVTGTVTPMIAPVDAFCNNAVPFTMTVSPSGGGWSGPNITPAGVVTPSNISNPGISTVVYTVTSGPCLNTGITSFKVVKYNTAAISGKINEQCAKGQPFNLMSVVSNTSGSWTGAGVAPSTSLLDPTYLSTGVYTYTYDNFSSPEKGVCDERKTVTVSVVNPITPTITSIAPLCSASAPVQLTVTPSDGAWVTTPYLNTNGVFIPQMSSAGNNIVKYVIGTPSCNRDATNFVNVEAFVSAAITVAKLPDLCNTSAGVNLAPFTLNHQGTWSGTGISGTNFNPGISGQGDFVLTYTIASLPTGVCTDQSSVAVTVHSLAVPSIASVERVCNNTMPIQLSPTPVGGKFMGINTDAVNSQGLFIPASAIIGANVVSYSISSGPCLAYAQTTLVVEKFVSADFMNYPEKFCRTNQPVNMNSYVQNPGGLWIGKGIVQGTSMFDPKLADNGDNNEITYITTSETKTLCPHQQTIKLTVTDMPVVQPVAEYAESCAPVIVRFNIPNTNWGDREWNVGDGSTPITGKEVEHTYSTPGSYTVVLNYKYEGCTAQVILDKPIEVFAVPEADFTVPEEVLISDPQVQLTNLTATIGNNKYVWFISGGVGTIEGEVNPKIILPKIGKYQITLTAENEHACKSEITKMIEVKNHFNIFIPTSFTPNYDGLNDEFKPVFTEFGLDTKNYEMEIFDRWGHSLFRSKDPSKGWDGSVKNSKDPAQNGVYIYKIRYRDMDGVPYEKMGQVSLLE